MDHHEYEEEVIDSDELYIIEDDPDYEPTEEGK
jgi:hypothetical protein